MLIPDGMTLKILGRVHVIYVAFGSFTEFSTSQFQEKLLDLKGQKVRYPYEFDGKIIK